MIAMSTYDANKHTVMIVFTRISICCNDAKCVQNQIAPFWIQVMFSVFRLAKYDDVRPNHTKKMQKCPKNAKKMQKIKKTQNSTTLHCNAQ